MIEYFEQSILHDYVAAFENYRIIWINLVLAVFGCRPKNAAQSRRVNMLLCGSCLARLDCAAVFSASKTRLSGLDKRTWGLRFEGFARDALSNYLL
jgi:hypothetical protein